MEMKKEKEEIMNKNNLQKNRRKVKDRGGEKIGKKEDHFHRMEAGKNDEENDRVKERANERKKERAK